MVLECYHTLKKRYLVMNEQGQEPQFTDYIQQVGESTKAFVNTKLNVWTLTASEHIGILSARAVLFLVGLALVGMIFLFSSFALAFWLGTILESAPLGYLCVAGLYVLLSFAFWLFWKHWLRSIIILNFVNDMYNKR